MTGMHRSTHPDCLRPLSVQPDPPECARHGAHGALRNRDGMERDAEAKVVARLSLKILFKAIANVKIVLRSD